MTRLASLLACALALFPAFMSRPRPAPPPRSPSASARPSHASGEITGRVVDKDGAPVGFVDVFLEGKGTSYAETVLSEEDGTFAFQAVPVGTYDLYAFSIGFVSDKITSIVVVSGAHASFNIALRSASAAQACEVQVRASELELVEASSELTGEFVSRIPLQPRRIQDIMKLMPGVVMSGSSDSTDISVGGGSSPSIGYRLNGASTNDPLDGGARFDVPTAAIEQFKLISTGYSAAFAETSTGMDEVASVAVDDGASREGYASIADNRFMDVALSPLTTFAVDVDTASYSNVRRFLTAGRLPPPGSVRVEEMVNYFDYDYPQAPAGSPFSIVMEVADCPWAPKHRLVHVGLAGRGGHGLSKNLVFLVDVSGSMESPDKLGLVKDSLAMLADTLGASDTIALVVYAGAAGVVLEPTAGSDKAAILDALARLQAGGSTNGGAGIQRAYTLARDHFKPGEVNRVILATDGDFNVGVSSMDELVQLIEKERESGVYLSVLGFGTGNLQDATMEKLADNGNGNYAYVDTIEEARKVLVEEMDATLEAVAKDVKVQVEFNPLEVASWRLVGYENRMLRNEDFEDDAKDAGDMGAGHEVTVLYEIVPAQEAAVVKTVGEALRYQASGTTDAARSGELMTVRLRYKEPEGAASALIEQPLKDDGGSLATASEAYRFSAAVASFALLLRGSDAGDATHDSVLALARGALGSDDSGLRAQFVGLVEKARSLSPAHAAVSGH